MESQLGDRRSFLISLMKKTIADYQNGKTNIDSLSSDLESIIDSMMEIFDQEFVNELRTCWASIEIAYSAALYRSHTRRNPPLNDEDLNAIRLSIECLLHRISLTSEI